ncbi:MAG: peptidylprolyl isomerase [Dehalococcoidia bacterium]|nr:peptidylprolyl isomerase [Dehalococcoidia bacterium]|tara:strand:+ start:2146 stop:2574 length:429 start_codon:yes stop_codon:yes gene_type:complete
MTEAKDGDSVKVQYVGKLEDGTTFDSSTEDSPLEFTIGSNQVIPGFNNGVIGMAIGESKSVFIPVADAYGPHQPEGVFEISRTEFPDDMNIEIGMRLEGNQQNGKSIQVTIIEINEDTIKLDANHPLAGKDLTFDITLVDIT